MAAWAQFAIWVCPGSRIAHRQTVSGLLCGRSPPASVRGRLAGGAHQGHLCFRPHTLEGAVAGGRCLSAPSSAGGRPPGAPAHWPTEAPLGRARAAGPICGLPSAGVSAGGRPARRPACLAHASGTSHISWHCAPKWGPPHTHCLRAGRFLARALKFSPPPPLVLGRHAPFAWLASRPGAC